MAGTQSGQGKELLPGNARLHRQTSKPTEILDCDALYEEPEEEEELLRLQNNNVNLQQPPVEARYEPWGDMHEDDRTTADTFFLVYHALRIESQRLKMFRGFL